MKQCPFTGKLTNIMCIRKFMEANTIGLSIIIILSDSGTCLIYERIFCTLCSQHGLCF